jgi:hypothetical protein
MKKLMVWLCVGIMSAMVLPAQDIDNQVRIAVNTLASKLNRRLDVSVGAITLAGTDEPSAFSRDLYTLITHYATNNNLFQVITPTRGPKRPGDTEKGIITGNFAKRGSNVEVILSLVNDQTGVNMNSARFTIPSAGYTLEPENQKAAQEQEKILTAVEIAAPPVVAVTPPPSPSPGQTPNVIRIQAWFDSESRTYLHCDELKMTVMADRDCYFKIIHIDANNQMKMIYPNSYDKNNNVLKANTPRTLFDGSNIIMHGPYGTETLVLIASADPFINIEREYFSPWVPATAESLKAAVSGGRGSSAVQSSKNIPGPAAGEARYAITILKPHEEYEYKKPSDMGDMVRTLRSDILQKGGFFEGNETFGVYTLDNIRASYRVMAEKPDTIQFATYYQDSYSGGPKAGTRSRGAGFNFSFAKPGNISQAIQSVRSGIEGSGGTFSGNEQNGNFKASGIAGQYSVSSAVNVMITEKPALIPNSLIEKEVKNYFSGQ